MNIYNTQVFNQFSTLINDNFLPSTSSQSKKITLIVSAVLSGLVICYLLFRCFFSSKIVKDKKDESSTKIQEQIKKIPIEKSPDASKKEELKTDDLAKHIDPVKKGTDQKDGSEKRKKELAEIEIAESTKIQEQMKKIPIEKSPDASKKEELKTDDSPKSIDQVEKGTDQKDGSEKLKKELAEIEIAELDNMIVEFELKNPEKVACLCKDILNIDPNHREALKRYAFILDKLRHDAQAIIQYQHYISTYPEDETVLMEYLALLDRLNKFDESIAALKEFLKHSPHHYRVLKYYAEFLRLHGRCAESNIHYKNLLEINPKDALVLMSYVENLIECGKLDDAKALLSLENDQQVDVLHRFAFALAQHGNVDAAIKEYENFLKEHPTYFQALLDYAYLLCSQQMYQEAIHQYEKILAIDPEPNDMDLTNSLSIEERNRELYWIKKECEAAIQNLQRLVKDPHDTKALKSYYDAKTSNLFDQKICEIILSHDPANADIFVRFMNLLFQSKKFDKAIHEYEKFLHNHPNNPYYVRIIETFARELYERGRYQQAAAIYKKALALDPLKIPEFNHEQFLMSYANVCIINGTFEEVLAEYPQLAHDRLLLQVYADDLLMKERYAEAEVQYVKNLKHDPDNENAIVNLGEALIKQGKVDEALHFYDHFVQKNPHSMSLLHVYAHALYVNQRFGDAAIQYKKFAQHYPKNKCNEYRLKELEAKLSV